MQEFTGEKTTYVVLQETSEVQQGEFHRQPLIYDARQGSFSSSGDILGATHFETQEEAVNLANLQNQISTILKQNFNYIVVENYIRRSQITGSPIVEDEDVVTEGLPE